MQYLRGKRKQQHYMTPRNSAALDDKQVLAKDVDRENTSGGGANGTGSATLSGDKGNLEATSPRKRKRHNSSEDGESVDDEKETANGAGSDGTIRPLRTL